VTDHFVFISYSRRQLYFAESLALHLQNAGLGVWFDLQQLNPGEDWQSEIQRGLDDYTALVLIASQSALASPYVRVEWEEALREGRPVIVCAYSAVTLPPELAGCPLIDFRGDFDRALQRLIAALRDGDKPQDRIPAPNRFSLQTRMPQTIWLMSVALLLSGVVLPLLLAAGVFVSAADSRIRDLLFNDPQLTLFLWISLLAVAGWLPIQFIGFLRHRAAYSPLRALVWTNGFALLLLCFCLLLALPSTVKIGIVIVGIVFAVLTVCAVYLLRSSAALLRWLPLDPSTPPAWRSRVNQKLLAGITSLEEIVRTITPLETMTRGFQVYAMPEDNRIAEKLVRAMHSAGHHYEADPAQATLFLAIVSNATQAAWLNTLIDQFKDRLICLIASPIQVGESVKQLSRYQYLDCRVRQTQRFATLAASLRGDAQSALFYSLNVIPADVSKLHTPASVTAYAHLLRASGAGAFANAVAFFLVALGLVNRGTAAIWTVPFLLGIGIGYYLISNRVLRRETTIWIGLGAAVALSLADAFVTGLNVGQVTNAINAISEQVSVLILTLAIFAWGIYQWLPSRQPPAETKSADRLTKSFRRRLLRMNAAYALIYMFFLGVVFTLPPARTTPITATGEPPPPLTEPLYYAGSENFSSLTRTTTLLYVAEADAFVAAFPAEPVISERRDGSGALIREYAAETDSGNYLVRVIDFAGVPDGRNDETRLDFFFSLANNALPGGTLLDSDSFTVGTISGRTFTIVGGGETLRGLVAVNGDKIYIISVRSPSDQADNVDIETFLGSFALFAEQP
jgi:hypothetical protein